MSDTNFVNLIRRKRDGGTLSGDEIQQLVASYTSGNVPDYQMSAWLMAAFLAGMDNDELYALTSAMLYSGEVLDLSDIAGTKVDKHSTGGVGDKISLILAPVVAACGVPVPMISGRGLGHTGGTLDKLEAIPGFKTDLSIDSYRKQLADINVVMIGQTSDIAPADKKLYALRDVTATVEFIPFIAASIMSKKLAEGIDALVLDVKCGSGAFMKNIEDATRLAETLCGIANHFDKQCTAWLTSMDTPLGSAIGTWPETEEAIMCLHGEDHPDVMQVVYALAADMLVHGKAAASLDEGADMARSAISSGSALDKFVELVGHQGGDVNVVKDPSLRAGFESAGEVLATGEGYVSEIDCYEIGMLAVEMGAGRLTKEDSVDPLAGIKLLKRTGDHVQPGEPIARLYTSKSNRVGEFSNRLLSLVSLQGKPGPNRNLLLNRLLNGTWTGETAV